MIPKARMLYIQVWFFRFLFFYRSDIRIHSILYYAIKATKAVPTRIVRKSGIVSNRISKSVQDWIYAYVGVFRKARKDNPV